MARDNKGFVCHNHTSMVSYEIHHVWPQCYGGPTVKWNLAKICPSAHSDIHYLMDRMLAGKSYNLREYGPAIRQLAKEGHDDVVAHIEQLIKHAPAAGSARSASS